MKKNKKGITLIALTIIVTVLSIIAGVTVMIVTNADIIGIARKTNEKYIDANIKQILDGIYLSEKNKYTSGLISEEKMRDNIKNAINSHEELKDIGVSFSETDSKLIISVDEKKYNYEITDIELIQFTIEGTTYYAEKGMTWGQWIESDQNINKKFYLNGNFVQCDDGYVDHTSGINCLVQDNMSTVTYNQIVLCGCDFRVSSVPSLQ